jgi:lysozyme family protein
MPIIRVTRKQIQAANKAREAALKKDDDFRRFEEQRQRRVEAAKAREVALEKQRKADAARNEEQPS